MTFAASHWAWWLFVLPVLALFKIAADARARRVTMAFAASERLRQMLQGGTSMIRSGVRFGLQLLGLGFFILALTQPQYGTQDRQIEQTGRNIFIAIDCSKSMLAEDVKPDRLKRAKLAAQDLLEKLPGDRVGLIAFAGRAFLQAPLTTDHEAVVESIQALDHTTIPRGGSSLGSAIALALHSVEQMPGRQHGLIIFTDGQETDNAMLATARDARQKNLLVLPVGVGTREGDVIPDPDPQRQGDYVRDENGAPVKSSLEVAALQELARVAGGEYLELNSPSLSQTVVDRVLSDLDRHRAESRQITRPIDRFQLPLAAGIICLAMSLIIRPSSRRVVHVATLPIDPQSTVHRPPPLPSGPVAVALLVILLLLSGAPSTMAATRRDLSAARRSYDDSHYDHARDAYKRMTVAKDSPEHADEALYGLGASHFKLRDYDAADRAFSDALKSEDPDVRLRAQRGLATALYDKGDKMLAKQPERTIKAWTDSVDHFDSAMKRTTEGSREYNELKANRDFVQKRLDELKQQQAEKENEQKQAGDKKGQGKAKGQSKGEEQQQESGEQQEEGTGNKTDAMQKQEAVPEGEIRAGEAGEPDEKGQAGEDDTKRNDKTGFSPEEARTQLRNYADDQKSVQYLMRDEKPTGGKDY